MIRPRAADDFATIRARWRSCAASALPALLTISQQSERAWKNCAASALRCRRHETPGRSARGLPAVSNVFLRAMPQTVLRRS